MEKRPMRIIRTHFAVLLLLLCMSLVLTSANVSAQSLQAGGSKSSALIPADQVKVRVIDLNTDQADALLPEAGLDASWVQGNTVLLEKPTALTANPLGFAGVVTIPASASLPGGNGGWIHFAIPTPVLSSGARAKLVRVLFHIRSINAAVATVDVWDGDSRLIHAEGTGVTSGLLVYELPTPVAVYRGIDLSLYVRGCLFVSPPGCDERSIQIVAVGADFTR